MKSLLILCSMFWLSGCNEAEECTAEKRLPAKTVSDFKFEEIIETKDFYMRFEMASDGRYHEAVRHIENRINGTTFFGIDEERIEVDSISPITSEGEYNKFEFIEQTPSHVLFAYSYAYPAGEYWSKVYEHLKYEIIDSGEHPFGQHYLKLVLTKESMNKIDSVEENETKVIMRRNLIQTSLNMELAREGVDNYEEVEYEYNVDVNIEQIPPHLYLYEDSIVIKSHEESYWKLDYSLESIAYKKKK